MRQRRMLIIGIAAVVAAVLVGVAATAFGPAGSSSARPAGMMGGFLGGGGGNIGIDRAVDVAQAWPTRTRACGLAGDRDLGT